MKHRSVAFACVAALALFIVGVWAGTTAEAAETGPGAMLSTTVTKRWIGPAAGPVRVHIGAWIDDYDDPIGDYTIPGTTTVMKTVTLDASNGWTARVDDLPQNIYLTTDMAGQRVYMPAHYFAVEAGGAPAGYASQVSGDIANGFTITNTNMAETSVTAAVAWDDADDAMGIRPSSAGLQLLADGAPVGSPVTVSDGAWSHTWSNLRVYDSVDGHAIAYTVSEVAVPWGYTASVTGDASSGLTVVNAHELATVETSVAKRWIGPAAGSARVEIVAQTEEHTSSDGSTVYGGEEWVERAVELDASGGWRADLVLPGSKNYGADVDNPGGYVILPVTYTVREVPVEGYDSTVSGDVGSGFTVTNASTALISVPVRAVWDDGDNADGIRPASVSWRLLADGAPAAASAEATAATGWAHTWEGLPLVADAHVVEYALASVEAPAGYTVSVEGDAASGYTVTYAHPVSGTAANGVQGGRSAGKETARRLPRTGDAAGIAFAAVAAASGAAGIGAALRRRNR